MLLVFENTKKRDISSKKQDQGKNVISRPEAVICQRVNITPIYYPDGPLNDNGLASCMPSLIRDKLRFMGVFSVSNARNVFTV